MPRNDGIYSPPAGTTATPQTSISSAAYNAFVADITSDQNNARPVIAGGTGASTAQGAIDSLFGTARTIKDENLLIVDPADSTKCVRIDTGAVTAGQTRVLEMPDKDVALGELLPKSGGTMSGDLDMGGNAVLNADVWALQPLGVPIPVWDHLDGVEPPATDKDYRYIKLTAGLTGSGAYNAGLLASESVTGSGALVVATAAISLSDSPMVGETVSLINTERRAIRAGSSGTTQTDAMQRITGQLYPTAYLGTGSATGAFSGTTTAGGTGVGGSGATLQTPKFDSGNSPGARVSDEETRGKNIGATFYMRIK